MLISYHLGATSIILRVKIRNSSVSTGAGLTGLTSASSGLIISTIADNESSPTTYTVAGSTIESITTLGTFATPTATKCRFKEVDSTNHKGIYEIQIDNARFSVSNAKSLLVSISGATNAAECDAVIPLTTVDPYDTKFGITANVPADAKAINAVSTSSVTTINANIGTTQPTNFTGTGASALVKGDAVDIGSTAAASATIGTVTNVTNGVTVTTNNDKTGYSLSVTPPTAAAIATAVWTDTTASDFTTASSPGKILVTQLGGSFTTTSSSVFTTAALANAPTGGGGGSDPWATTEPGSYASGTFGNLVATALTSTTSWIFAAASYTAPSLPAALGTPRQIANTPYTKTFTQNCLRTAIADQLVDAATNAPINLTGSNVTFRMISQVDKSTKINDVAATLTDAPNGKVAYSWTGTDLDTPGLYWGFWVVTTNGKTERFPPDEKMTVKVVAAE